MSNLQSLNKPYWFMNPVEIPKFSSLDKTHSTEILVIGAGICGLTIALELLERGHKVTVCDSNRIGHGTTAASTGHLDVLPEIGCSRLVSNVGMEDAVRYINFRTKAVERIKLIGKGCCDFTMIPAYRYTEVNSNLDQLKSEERDAFGIGLDTVWCNQVPIPKALGGFQIDGMARINTLKYLKSLTERVVLSGGMIFEETLVSGPIEANPKVLIAGNHEIYFEHVVCAVNSNHTDVQRLYMETPPYQSYVFAVEVEENLEDALFWDNSEPYYYVRKAVSGIDNILLIGGKDHRTGNDDEAKSVEELLAWIQKRFAVKKLISCWSAELFEPVDGLPMIGKVPGKTNVWTVIGLSGIGLTLGTGSAVLIADLIEGKESSCAEMFSPDRFSLKSVGNVIKESLVPLFNYSKKALPQSEIDLDKLERGMGVTGSLNGKNTAVCRDHEGCLHKIDPICNHMGGLLKWNSFEQTWDCPVHGGRFTKDGKRLYGPPEVDLENFAACDNPNIKTDE